MRNFSFAFIKKALVAIGICAGFANATANMQMPSAKKIVVLDPAIVEIMYMLEAEDQIAAISTLKFAKIWPEEKTAKLKSVGTYTKPNLEQVVELKPDLVVTSFHSAGVNEDIKKFNLPSLTLKADSVDDIISNIEQMGKITGKEDKAKQLVSDIKAKFKSLRNSSLKGKKVISVFSSNPLTGFSAKTLPGDIFAKLDMINLADKLEGSTPIVSTEFILTGNPDFIIVVGGMGESDDFLKQNPILSKTTAAKNGKVLIFPSSMILRGSPRISETIDKLYKELTK